MAPKMTIREARAQAKQQDRLARERWQALLAQEGTDLDEDGYPTALACERIEAWHHSDPYGWLRYIAGLWQHHFCAWSERQAPSDMQPDRFVQQYHISTMGWSGNETLIRAMEQNAGLWDMAWVQSRRGGHYLFELELPPGSA